MAGTSCPSRNGRPVSRFWIRSLNIGQLWDTRPADWMGPRVHAFVVSIERARRPPWSSYRSGSSVISPLPEIIAPIGMLRVKYGRQRGLCCFGVGGGGEQRRGVLCPTPPLSVTPVGHWRLSPLTVAHREVTTAPSSDTGGLLPTPPALGNLFQAPPGDRAHLAVFRPYSVYLLEHPRVWPLDASFPGPHGIVAVLAQ